MISGHSHTIVDTRVGHTLVIQASSYTRAFDEVHLLLDRKAGTIAASWGSVQPTWRTTPPITTDPAATAVKPDPAVQTIVDDAVTATNPITQQVINTAAADIPSQREGGATAAGESPAGDLVADSQRAYAHTQLAFVNTGSIRAGLLAGPVTYGNLFTMQPFQDDYVDTFTLTGAQVWALLSQQLATGTGGIMQISGPALHLHRQRRVPGRITGVWLGAAGDDSAPIADSNVEHLHRHRQLVHDGRRRRLHRAGVGRQHRADCRTPNWCRWSTTSPPCPTRSPTPRTAGSPKPDRPRHRDQPCRVVPPSGHALTPAERSASNARPHPSPRPRCARANPSAPTIPASRRFRVPRIHSRHDVPSLRHRSEDETDQSDRVATRPAVLPLRRRQSSRPPSTWSPGSRSSPSELGD